MDPRTFDYSPRPIRFLNEDFIAGFRQNQRMSVVRRFFCLFVTFDLIFVTLLWLICTVINGENIYKALESQIVNYTIETSLFDVVVTAAARFFILILFYAILKIDHWIVIALTTSLSCGFLITKVFFYEWPLNQQPFQVLLIIISFVISWFEAWFLDSRMIPQEEYSRTLTQALHSGARETSPLLAPFLHSFYGGNFHPPPESFRQSFYSPVESVTNSDDEDDELKQLGIETVQKAYELLESTSWKVEKVTANNDTIYTTVKPIGKVYKLRAKVDYSAKKLLQELFYNIEDFPKWNPTLLESKILKKIDSSTDISYSISTSGGGGIVKSRDFVNLRCWRLVNNARVVENYNLNSSHSTLPIISNSTNDKENENRSENRKDNVEVVNEKTFTKSASDVGFKASQEEKRNGVESQLSKSLGAADINCVSDDDELFADAETEVQQALPVSDACLDQSKNVFVSAAISVDFADYLPTTKYIRGENIVSCWAMRPVDGADSSCIFEWLMCLDLKGSLPKYVLNTAFVSLMTDYMTHLRKRVQALNDRDKAGSNHPTC